MGTRRETIAGLLQRGERTAKDLASLCRANTKDVLSDLEHIRRSVGRRFRIDPALCGKCDFVFETRSKLQTPSRCPECKNERILPAKFWVDRGQSHAEEE